MIFMPHNVPSLKNSKVATLKGVFHSKTVSKYLQKIGVAGFSSSKKKVKYYKKRPNMFDMILRQHFTGIDKPVVIGFHFVRDTTRQFDFHNAVQILADLFVAHDFIEDDSMKYFIPFPLMLDGKWYSFDKNKPGVYIKIINKTKVVK